jgi:hypothetical protein
MGGLISLALRDCGLISFMICGVAIEIGIDPIADFEAGGAAAIEADKMEAVLADFPTSKGWSMEQFAAVRTREIYRSPNGDRWLLARDPDIGRVFVRGGQPPALRSELFSSRLVTDQRSIPAAELGRPPDLTVGRTRLRPSEP